MKNRTHSFVSFVVLVVYGTLTFVAVPLHFHEDSLLTTGRGVHALVQHDDALHCHHRVIESHDDCTICTFVLQTAAPKIIAVLPHVTSNSVEYISASCGVVIHEVYSTHSRRGPPVNPA